MRILAFLLAVLAGLVPAPAAADVRVTSRTYDLLDRLETETVALEDGGSATVRYTYYNDGRRRTLTDAFGRVTFYEYDGRGNLKRVTANQGLPDQHVTSYEYWPDDLLRTITKPNGTVTSYEYDRADRLTSVVVRLDAAVLASFAYTYDANGNRLTQVETNGSGPETTSYTYDALNRLETVTYPDGSSAAYSYDAVGNRVREVSRDSVGAIVSDKTASFDSINRLTSLADAVDPSGSATLTWDRNGNLLSKATPAGTESYGYDAADHLVETRSGSSITARFAFDPFGRRHLKVGTDSRQYLYDETSTLHELDSDDLEVAKYEYGGDRLLSFVRRDEARRFYHLDGLGSPAALSDSGGSVVARYHLDAWGRYRVPSELSLSANRFGFTGYLFDQETDLYYAKARFYDPELGRFTTQDSVLGEVDEPPSLNRYFYGNANPLRFIDPFGHAPDEIADRAREYGRIDETIIGMDESGRVIRGHPAVAAPSRETATAEQVDLQHFQADDRRKLNKGSADAIARHQRDTFPISIREVDPDVAGCAGDATCLNVLSARRDALAAGEQVGRVGGTLGREVISLGGGTASDAFAAGTGVDLATEQELSIGERFLAGGAAILPLVSRRDVQLLQRLTPEVAEARRAARAERNTAAAERQIGSYRGVGGHHVHAKAAFRGHGSYNPHSGFSISQEFMESHNWNHQDMTRAQVRLFKDLANSGRPNTLAEHSRIAVQALQAGGASETQARALVAESLRDLRSQGVRVPTRIPWFEKDK
jgi:RHS repeat-associated protein